MTMIQQEFRADGLPSLKPYLNYLIDHGAAEQVNVKWGKGHRNVIVIMSSLLGVNTCQYTGGNEFNNRLNKTVVSLCTEWRIQV